MSRPPLRRRCKPSMVTSRHLPRSLAIADDPRRSPRWLSEQQAPSSSPSLCMSWLGRLRISRPAHFGELSHPHKVPIKDDFLAVHRRDDSQWLAFGHWSSMCTSFRFTIQNKLHIHKNRSVTLQSQ
ncbi:hypothetical protein PVAP13_8KG281505 [Panicum virgatum]|uniref:Uncharacterized protein n=1 Tax=Panicum virgatum TaxID=38727 RepID=A0A8T0PX45_PANVG|nr:hypothetical protein PVAP13_8KG281505 [Panicum virgatum]